MKRRSLVAQYGCNASLPVIQDILLSCCKDHTGGRIDAYTKGTKAREGFLGKELNVEMNLGKSVVVNGVIQGSILSIKGGEAVQDLMMLNGTPLSLGTDANGGLMVMLIKHGIAIQSSMTNDCRLKTIIVWVYSRWQTFHWYQGCGTSRSMLMTMGCWR